MSMGKHAKGETGHVPKGQMGGEPTAKLLTPEQAENARRIARDSFAVDVPNRPKSGR